jgi:GT2 family glycosyltransferase
MEICNKFIIGVPYCEIYKPYFIKCLTSLESQNYNNIEIIIIVDGFSSDLKELYKFIEKKKIYTIFIFKENNGPAFSKWILIKYIKNNIHKYSYNDIFCILDGDDYIENDALRIINDLFQKKKCWITFGNAKGKFCDFVIPENYNSWLNIRKEKWIYNHLRCFKLHLLLNFVESDFKMDNKWLTKGTDRPLVYNCTEMAGFDRCVFNEKIIYNYMEHENNSYKTVDYKTKMTQINYLSNIVPKPKIIEDIHIVMCVYKRVDNFEQQINNLNNQTVSNRIVLHVINNNTENKNMHNQMLKSKNLQFRYNVYEHDNKYYGFQRFLTIRDVLLKKYILDYVIMIDDDQLFDEDWVEKMYNLRTPQRYFSWYVKKWNNYNLDYWNGSLILSHECKYNVPKELDNFHFGATCGCIIDVNIFNENTELWNIPTDLPNDVTVYNIEDLWLSYVILNHYKWKIKRTFLPEKYSFNQKNSASDAVSLWHQLKNQKTFLFNKLFTNYIKNEKKQEC